MASPKLFLHIGYPKTGTSSLQRFFETNEKPLRDAGLLYASTGRINGQHFGIAASLGLVKHPGPEPVPDLDTLAAQLKSELDVTGARSLLISSEFLALSRKPERIEAAFKGFDVRVVVYLRRHDHALESAFGQAIKTVPSPRWLPGIDPFVLHSLTTAHLSYDYYTVLRKWSATFGRSHIIVRPFERSQNLPNLYADFLNTIGFTDIDGLASPDVPVNTAVSPRYLMAIDAIQRSVASPDLRRVLIGSLLKLDAAQPPGNARTRWMSPATRTMLVQKYAPSYAAIAREFLGRPDGVLFEEASPSPGDEWHAPQTPTTQEIVDTIIEAVGARFRPTGAERRAGAAEVDAYDRIYEAAHNVLTEPNE